LRGEAAARVSRPVDEAETPLGREAPNEVPHKDEWPDTQRGHRQNAVVDLTERHRRRSVMMRCFWITLLQTPLSWAFIMLFAGVGIIGFIEYVPPTWHDRALVVVAATGVSVALVCCGLLSAPG
jgi:hypothetical protein